MNTLHDYTIIIRPEINGAFVATIPAIEGCYAYGITIEEAQSELQHVFDMISEEYQEENKPLPPDCEISIAHAG